MPEVIPYNPLLIFKYLVYFVEDGDNPLLGISKMGAGKLKNEMISWRAAGHVKNSASQIPGGTTWEPIAFEQGLGLDDGRLETWALATSNWKEGQGGHDPANFRKDLRVDVLNLSGETALTYLISQAWVTEAQLFPELDANNLNTVGIFNLTVAHEGITRLN